VETREVAEMSNHSPKHAKRTVALLAPALRLPEKGKLKDCNVPLHLDKSTPLTRWAVMERSPLFVTFTKHAAAETPRLGAKAVN
jgi:hypothetical protein